MGTRPAAPIHVVLYCQIPNVKLIYVSTYVPSHSFTITSGLLLILRRPRLRFTSKKEMLIQNDLLEVHRHVAAMLQHDHIGACLSAGHYVPHGSGQFGQGVFTNFTASGYCSGLLGHY